jgi:hypothetical protein
MGQVSMIVATITEVEDGYLGQMYDDETGAFFGQIFQARQRGELIAEMSYRIPLSHLEFRDDTSGSDQ